MGEVPGTPPCPGQGDGRALRLCWSSRPNVGHHRECSHRHPQQADQLAQGRTVVQWRAHSEPVRARFLTPHSSTGGLGARASGRAGSPSHLGIPRLVLPPRGRMQTEGGSGSQGCGCPAARQTGLSRSQTHSPRSAAGCLLLSSPLPSPPFLGSRPGPRDPGPAPPSLPLAGSPRVSRTLLTPSSTDPRRKRGGLPAPPPSLGGEEDRAVARGTRRKV